MRFIDWETESALDITKVPTMQYVRASTPLALGWGEWNGGLYAEFDKFSQFLDPDICCAHNAAFDAAVGHHHFNHQPRLWLDTMSMARYAVSQGHLPPNKGVALRDFGAKGDTMQALQAGGPELEKYVKQDVRILRKLAHKLLPLMPERELRLINLHVKMASIPRLHLDTDVLGEHTQDDPLLGKLRSKATFVSLLRKFGVEPGYKPGKRKDEPALAKNDEFMLSLLRHPDARVRTLAQARLQVSSSITRTRAQRFLDIGEPMPCPLLYYGGHTGRSSGADKLNLQNLPRGGALRRSLLAPPGYKLVVCDSAQIEARVLAWLAGEETLLESFRAGADPYVAFASRLYHVSPDMVTGEQRRVSKAAVLALGFAQGVKGFLGYCAGFGIAMDEATGARIVHAYRELNPRIVSFWYETKRKMLREGEIRLPTGRKLTYPDLYQEGQQVFYKRPLIFSKGPKGERDVVKVWHGLLVENLVQAVARDVVVLEQTLNLANRWDVVLSVHDEVVLCVREDEAEVARRDAERAFSRAPEWAEGLPVKGEAIITDNYGDKPS